MSRWLITHFDPFSGSSSNSSAIVAQALKASGSDHIFAQTLPTSFKKAWQILEASLQNSEIAGVLSLGQAYRRDRVSMERVAFNWMDPGIPDNDGYQPVDEPVMAGAPDLLWTDLPVRQWLDADSQVSYCAGTFLCNFVYYKALYWAQQNGKKALFLHIPVLASQLDPQYLAPDKVPDAKVFATVQRIVARLP